MPPPRNGSLGRGLGDLLGGVPESIGVAGAPQAPAGKPLAAPVQEPPAPPAPPPPAGREEEPGSPDPAVGVQSCWKPGRVALAFIASLLLVITGVFIGARAVAHREAPEPVETFPAPVVVVTNTVVVPAKPPVPEAIDVAPLKALEEGGLTIASLQDGAVKVVFNAPVFSSRATLDPDQAPCLEQLGSVLAAHSGEWEVRVVGHTDDIPFRGSGTCRDNRELGLARAVEVVRYLCRQAGVPASMLSAATAGEDNPPFPGDDPGSRLKNRTVTLLIRLPSR